MLWPDLCAGINRLEAENGKFLRDFMRRRRTTSHENGFGRRDLEAGSVSVVARAFHSHMGAALGQQPFAHAEQRCGAEGPHLLLHFAVFPNNQQGLDVHQATVVACRCWR